MAKEHGMMEHAGKTIPREVKSLADRIRAKEPGYSDESAYRTAWDVFEHNTSEGRAYKPEGGKHHHPEDIEGKRQHASPFHKTGEAMDNFWNGFEKQAKKLTSAERNAIPSGEFAEPKERKYPIEDKAHARNAEARVAQHGTPAEQAAVHAKVHSKFPDIGEK